MSKAKEDKLLILKSFGNHFVDWLDWITTIFPNDTDIASGKIVCVAFKKTNPKVLANLWYNNIYKIYKKNINEADYAFFTEKDYTWDITSEREIARLVNTDRTLRVIHEIRCKLRTLPDETKKECMKYMKNISKLCVLYLI